MLPSIALWLLLAATPPPASGEASFAAIRPLLEARCGSCHSEASGKQKGGLRVDRRDALLRGGHGGPALVPGDPEASLLIRAVAYADPDLEMPPDGRLPDQEIALLRRWVQAGAPWPADTTVPRRRPEKAITDADRSWWAFQPVRSPPVPGVGSKGGNGPENEIDRFVRARLAASGLTPAPPADRRTLIRRLTFDLHGLPPTPEDIDAFLKDLRPDAYERLVDRLLASPRYGERLARLWLDVVRYAESDGYRADSYRPETWPYRDYVIRSFNEDKPYDRFVLEQLAGDEIAPADPAVFVGTTFLRLGQYEWNQRDVRLQWGSIVDEVTDVTADAFLGLGMACARCHDHKFDPLLQRDYYRLRAFFAPLAWPVGDRAPLLASPDEERAYRAALASWEARTAPVRAEIAALERPYLEAADAVAVERFPPDIQALLRQDPRALAPEDRQLHALAWRQILAERNLIDGKIKGDERTRWSELKRRLAALGAPPAAPLRAFVGTDIGPHAPPTFIPGDPERALIQPGFPTVLDPAPAAIPGGSEAAGSTGRRTALARWIGSPENPLAARVLVNRLWQRFFGRGLVATASDFGRLGEEPSHPELLDWLAARFVAGGQRVKPLERLIVTSATYRQSAVHPRAAKARIADPDNRLLWRHRIRRLDAEEVRDAILMVTGELDPAAGGPSVDASVPRRTIYTKVLRNTRDPLLASFDAPDGLASTATRNVTTTAAQALLLLNARWSLARAEALAARLVDAETTDAARLDRAHRLAFGRAPGPAERRRASSFLRASADRGRSAAERPTPTEAMPLRGGKAIRVSAQRLSDRLAVTGVPTTPSIALEGVGLLDAGSERRVLAALEPDAPGRASLALGVTGRGEVVAWVRGPDGEKEVGSDLRVEPHKPHYLAVAAERGALDQPLAFTFHVRDLSDPDAPFKTARVDLRGVVNAPWGRRLVIGGASEGAGWDGLVDEIRVSATLSQGERLADDLPRAPAAVLAHHTFESPEGPRHEAARRLPPLAPLAASVGGRALPAGWVDLCHALLNANELVFVE